MTEKPWWAQRPTETFVPDRYMEFDASDALRNVARAFEAIDERFAELEAKVANCTCGGESE